MIIALVLMGLLLYSFAAAFTAGAISDVCKEGWIAIMWGVFWPIFWIICLFEFLYRKFFEIGRRL